MKNSAKIITAFALVLCANLMQAQPGKETKQAMRDRIESQRIAFITDKLALTPTEAQNFWPVFNEFRSKQQELRKQFVRSDEISYDKIEILSDKEASELADNQLVFAQKQLDLRKEYHSKLKAVLPPKKVLKLYETEREFQKMLMNRIKERQEGRPVPSRGRMLQGE